MDRRTLSRLVREWLKRLSLKGWTVDVRLVRHAELAGDSKGSCYARVSPDPATQRAAIRLCRESDLAAAGLEPGLTEETIVHELLHLLLDPMSTLAGDAAFEIGLDRLAGELVRMARAERKRKRPHR